MESEFLSKYGDEDNFDEDKMTEDLITFMLQVGLKEKRKELAEEYIEKIKQTEKEN